MASCPPHLQRLLRSYIAEEVMSLVRHSLRNKLAAVRNASFYIKRKVETTPTVLKDDPRVAQFFAMIDSEISVADEILARQLLSRPDGGGAANRPAIDAALVASRLLAAIEPPPGTSISGPEPGPLLVGIDEAELELALFCLVENAFEAAGAGGWVRVVATPHADGQAALEVHDGGPGFGAGGDKAFEPFFTTKASHQGLGLKIARRIARHWGGDVLVGDRDGGGGRARLVLRAASAPGRDDAAVGG